MKHRDYFINRLKKHLIGPSETQLVDDIEEELLFNAPLQTYYSAVLFPEIRKSGSIGQNDDFSSITIADTDDAYEVDQAQDDESTDGAEQVDASDDTQTNLGPTEDATKDFSRSNNYFPSNCGFTFCISDTENKIEVQFTAARYKLITDNTERKVLIDKSLFDNLKNDDRCEFRDFLQYTEDGYLYLTRDLYDYRGEVSRFNRSTDFIHREIISKIELFAYRQNIYKRVPLEHTLSIDLANIGSTDAIRDVFKVDDKVIAKCFIKIYKFNGKTFLKILLHNSSTPQPQHRFSNGNEDLNQKCLFQVSLKAYASQILPYKDYFNREEADKETRIINLQYRKLSYFGLGHGCAVIWEQAKEPQWISTSFLPEVKIDSVSQDFRHGQKHLSKIAQLKNLSVWTEYSKREVCEQLRAFVDAYRLWIQEQKEEANLIEDSKELTEDIINKQLYNYKRLLSNINILETDNDAFLAFQLANTSMLIQMIISRDDKFSKLEKNLEDVISITNKSGNIYSDINFFKSYESEYPPQYRPFQLAFLLLNLEGIVNPGHADRTDCVDLLWFPTGGGKTEAYLAITAFTIFWRRLRYPAKSQGVSVIMRYTLRLLTSQQFERASRLICSMEFMRQNQGAFKVNLGEEAISIGMWVGGATTPNTIEDAKDKMKDISNLVNKNKIEEAKSKNVFQISACPFCGTSLIGIKNKKGVTGFSAGQKSFKIMCLNQCCAFEKAIPLQVVDEELYNNPPTLLFATVDKFAMLSHRAEGHKFFNSYSIGLPPDLIIQDELHLLNGPLGSIVGLYETIIEMLCSKDGRKPKIIASTATTRNTDNQVRQLYGGRTVNIFPPQGINYDDSYFSRITGESKRKHIGFMPTGKTVLDTQVRAVIPALLMARIDLYKKERNTYQNYWTLVSYYNSLKDVGKVYNKVGDEIVTELRKFHKKESIDNYLYNFNYQGIVGRTSELTSRIDSQKIKTVLKELEVQPIVEKKVSNNGSEYFTINNVIDLVLASNMFSVGIDIERLNVMLMNGQPKNIAEYIQASSRVGRKWEGLVVNFLDANRSREKSYFENYLPFHQAYYRYVEPLTVTPFTHITLDKVLNSIIICYVRHKKGLHEDQDAHRFDGDLQELVEYINTRIEASNQQFNTHIDIESAVKNLADKWQAEIERYQVNNEILKYKNLIKKADEVDDWALITSMREVDTNTNIKITSEQNINHDEEI